MHTPAVLDRSARNLWFAVGRLANGATIDSAQAELDTIGRRLMADHPASNDNVRPHVQTFREFFLGPHTAAIYAALTAAVFFVLVIVCANLANLQLTRAVSRATELSMPLE